MAESTEPAYGRSFDRILVGLLTVATGCTLAYLAIAGPLVLRQITYRTSPLIMPQIEAQDIVNLFLLAPLLITAGITLILRRRISMYLLAATPLYLIYYVLSCTIGWEWSSPVYTGNNEQYMFHFLFILVGAVIILLYTLSLVPARMEARFATAGLVSYSIAFTLFLCVFAAMWIGEIREVMASGTARGYDIAPTAFWVVRIFDLGFSIPLGLISVYLLWTRPATTYPVQLLFYGFFLTMIVAVNTMGIMMLVRKDPTFLWRDLFVFLILAFIIGSGFIFILRHYRRPPPYGG